LAAKGWRHTEKAKAAIRAANLGRKTDEATKRKLRASAEKFWQRVKQLEAEAADRAA
jgi:hypothetical protein